METRLIDLSVFFEDVPTSPEHHRPQIQYTDHDASFDAFSRAYGGISKSDLPDGKAWAVERVSMSTHAGTHMDAPYHYHPTTNHLRIPGGERASTIDEVPLDLCMRPGVKLDLRRFDAGYVVTPRDIDEELDRIGYEINRNDIVLANTAAGALHGTPEYADGACGFGRAATLHLLEKGVSVVGTDSYTWDPSFKVTAQRFREGGNPEILWEGHKAGKDVAYWQMEKLCNLDKLPPFGFTVICFPLKIRGASAAWTRAVAVVNNNHA